MSVFAVVLNDPDERAWDSLRTHWPDRHLVVTDRLAFVAPETLTLTQDVADTLGMNQEKKVLGIVIEMANRSGFNKSSLTEWLEKAA